MVTLLPERLIRSTDRRGAATTARLRRAAATLTMIATIVGKAGATALAAAAGWRMVAVQLAGVASVLWGIAAWSRPSAYIVGGLVAVVVVELRGRSGT